MNSKVKIQSDDKFMLVKQMEDWLSAHASTCIRSCQGCSHMVTNGPVFCNLYNTVPPVDIIVRGCEHHLGADDIPF